MVIGLRDMVKTVEVPCSQVYREYPFGQRFFIRSGKYSDAPVFPHPLPQRDKLIGNI
jgi:hypothetical protein